MTDTLKSFLKQNQQILNDREFPLLFQICPTKELRKELFDLLTENNLETDLSQIDPQGLYLFKYYERNYFLGIEEFNKKDKSYVPAAIPDKSSNLYKMITMHGFENALKFSLTQIAGNYTVYSVPLDIEENWDWVPIKISWDRQYNLKNVLTTQELVDSFDPIKIKANRILNAARDEYKNELNYQLNNLLGPFKREELANKISNLSNKNVAIYNDNIFGYLDIECFKEDDKIRNNEDEILSLIKKYIPRKNIKIIKYPKGFKIHLDKETIDKVKSEIFDTFEVKL